MNAVAGFECVKAAVAQTGHGFVSLLWRPPGTDVQKRAEVVGERRVCNHDVVLQSSFDFEKTQVRFCPGNPVLRLRVAGDGERSVITARTRQPAIIHSVNVAVLYNGGVAGESAFPG